MSRSAFTVRSNYVNMTDRVNYNSSLALDFENLLTGITFFTFLWQNKLTRVYP